MPTSKLYFDNVSSTKINKEVLDTYVSILKKYYGNSASVHDKGREVKRLEDRSRLEILKLLELKNYDLIFTSGATEANNMVIKGTAFKRPGGHIITSEIEHASVLEACRQLEEFFDYKITYLSVDEKGLIDLDELKAALRVDTVLVSIIAVNNEIGSYNDPRLWVPIVKEHSNAATHADLVQAIAKVDVEFDLLDFFTLSAHKLHGLKGSGVLIKRDHLDLVPLLSGGSQENNLRAGTTNAPTNIVFAKTLRLALENFNSNREKMMTLYKYFIERLKKIEGVVINSTSQSPFIINFSTKGLTSEVLLNALNTRGIYVSALSTCNSKTEADSYVLKAIGVKKDLRQSSIRVGLDYTVEKKDIDLFIETLKEIIEKYAIKI